MSITQKIARVHERMQFAARRAGRDPKDIALMAVTKTVSADLIREAFNAGVRLFGENRVQEFDKKRDALLDLRAARWHMIGHLQTNKAERAFEIFDAVDSVDSIRLAQKLNGAAATLGKKIPVLIEINIGGEQAKSGTPPGSPELDELLCAAPELPGLDFRGLMTVPPYQEDAENSRFYFRKMHALFCEISGRKLPALNMEILSMGMSHDFEIAIEEGSTCVRVGTAIFGERQAVRRRT